MDWALDVEHGAVSYSFRTGRQGFAGTLPGATGSAELLHYAYGHHAKLLVQPRWASLMPMRAPTKGEMLGVLGKSWRLEIEMQGPKVCVEESSSLLPLFSHKRGGEYEPKQVLDPDVEVQSVGLGLPATCDA